MFIDFFPHDCSLVALTSFNRRPPVIPPMLMLIPLPLLFSLQSWPKTSGMWSESVISWYLLLSLTCLPAASAASTHHLSFTAAQLTSVTHYGPPVAFPSSPGFHTWRTFISRLTVVHCLPAPPPPLHCLPPSTYTTVPPPASLIPPFTQLSTVCSTSLPSPQTVHIPSFFSALPIYLSPLI